MSYVCREHPDQPVDRAGRGCRECQPLPVEECQPDNPCMICGADAPNGDRCHSCRAAYLEWREQQPRCKDCGGLNGMAHHGKRCRPCYLAHRGRAA